MPEFLWPEPVAAPTKRPCRRCGTPAAVGRLTDGYGESCARELGLTTSTPRLRNAAQTGPDLFEGDDDEPEDHCDGWDR